jgi:hypothetical protein
MLCFLLIGSLAVWCHGQIFGLLQVAGPINATVGIGQSADFNWTILPDKGKAANVTISAEGNGSQYLSFPKFLELPEGKFTAVPIKVTIPSNYSQSDLLHPKLRATQAGQPSNEGSIINVEVAKNVTLKVTNFSSTLLPNDTNKLTPANSTQ